MRLSAELNGLLKSADIVADNASSHLSVLQRSVADVPPLCPYKYCRKIRRQQKPRNPVVTPSRWDACCPSPSRMRKSLVLQGSEESLKSWIAQGDVQSPRKPMRRLSMERSDLLSLAPDLCPSEEDLLKCKVEHERILELRKPRRRRSDPDSDAENKIAMILDEALSLSIPFSEKL